MENYIWFFFLYIYSTEQTIYVFDFEITLQDFSKKKKKTRSVNYKVTLLLIPSSLSFFRLN